MSDTGSNKFAGPTDHLRSLLDDRSRWPDEMSDEIAQDLFVTCVGAVVSVRLSAMAVGCVLADVPSDDDELRRSVDVAIGVCDDVLSESFVSGSPSSVLAVDPRFRDRVAGLRAASRLLPDISRHLSSVVGAGPALETTDDMRRERLLFAATGVLSMFGRNPGDANVFAEEQSRDLRSLVTGRNAEIVDLASRSLVA